MFPCPLVSHKHADFWSTNLAWWPSRLRITISLVATAAFRRSPQFEPRSYLCYFPFSHVWSVVSAYLSRCPPTSPMHNTITVKLYVMPTLFWHSVASIRKKSVNSVHNKCRIVSFAPTRFLFFSGQSKTRIEDDFVKRLIVPGTSRAALTWY